MDNQGIVNQFISQFKQQNGRDLEIDQEKVDNEILKYNRAYNGLGIKILSICGGLLGSLFFLGFIVITISQSATALFVFGLLVLLAAIVLDRKSNNSFLDAACIGAFLSGYILLGYSAKEIFHAENVTVILFIIVALITVLLTENYMLNMFSVLIFNACLFAFIEINNVKILTHLLTAFISVGFVYFNVIEAKAFTKSANLKARYRPFCIAFLISLLVLLTYLSINFAKPQIPHRWVSSTIIIGLTLFSIHYIINFLKVEKYLLLIYAFSLAVLASVFFAPSICGAILILIIGIHIGYRLTIALGVMALIYFVGQFYYDLQFTLLTKSILMMLTGVLMLSAGYVFNKQLKAHE